MTMPEIEDAPRLTTPTGLQRWIDEGRSFSTRYVQSGTEDGVPVFEVHLDAETDDVGEREYLLVDGDRSLPFITPIRLRGTDAVEAHRRTLTNR